MSVLRQPAAGLLALGAVLASLGVASVAQAAPKELVVQQSQVSLLSSCDDGSAMVAELPQGQTVRLRFALAGGGSRCYSVETEIEGRTFKGYVYREALAGLEDFEGRRREAASRQLVETAVQMIGLQETEAARPSSSQSLTQRALLLQAAAELQEGRPSEAERMLLGSDLPADDRDAALLRSRALMQLHRPREALNALDPALRAHGRDAQLLAMAGISSFELDDMRAAEAYLRESLAIEPAPWVEGVYRKVKRETAADQSHEKSYGSRFTLRYEGEALDAEAARRVTAAFESEVTRISQHLGCRLTNRLPVIIQSRENYRNTTGAADWSGGRYDGRIRIALPPSGEVDGFVRQAFSHEFVHACLSTIGRWPSWLHEGLAQKLSGDVLSSRMRAQLVQLGGEDKLPKLNNLAGGWGGLNSQQAQLAYGLSLAATEIFVEHYQYYGLRNLMNDPSLLDNITRTLDRKLAERYH